MWVKSELQLSHHPQITPRPRKTGSCFCSLKGTDFDYEKGEKGSRDKQVTKTGFQEPVSMPSKPVPGESKQAAFCWHHSLKPFREHSVRSSESHRCECPQNVHLNRGDKFSHNRDNTTAVVTYFCKLSLVESRPSLQLIMSLVTSKGVHLELEQVNLEVMKRRGHEHYL